MIITLRKICHSIVITTLTLIIMRKKFIVSTGIAGLILTSCAMQEPEIPVKEQATRSENFITIDEALANARNQFSIAYGEKPTRAGKNVESIEIKNPRKLTRSDGNDTIYGYYLVNYKDGKGFALLSADKRRSPVLALSDKGEMHFRDTLFNEGLNWYINEALPQFDYAITIPTGPGNPPVQMDSTLYPFNPWVNKSGKEVFSEPLIAKNGLPKFHQKSPYNKYCFTFDGQQAVVGCVPLAVGTIMGYYKWPASYKNYTFDWTAMYSNFYHDSWSRLFEVLGSSELIRANYGKDATGAGTEWVPYTFATMRYKGTNIKDFSSYTLQEELKSSNPVICLGSARVDNTGKDIGHAWIIDGGYKTWNNMAVTDNPDGIVTYYYYHCVWGWNGISDGYFLLKSGELGGRPDSPDGPYYDVACNVYRNLSLVYGFRPNK